MFPYDREGFYVARPKSQEFRVRCAMGTLFMFCQKGNNVNQIS